MCSQFMPSISQLYFMVVNDLLSYNLVNVTLAEQASEWSRKTGNPLQPRSAPHIRNLCSQSTLKTR